MKIRFALRFATRPLEQMRRWASDHLIQNVPDDVSFCEYECQDPDCHIAKWALCEKRTTHLEQAMVRID